jgi:hypothetical protein
VFTDLPASSSLTNGNTEFIQIVASTTGFWYVDVYAFSGATAYQVTTTIN